MTNDLKFAKWWVEQRGNFRPKPKRILKIELTKKGIVKEIIDTFKTNLSQPHVLQSQSQEASSVRDSSSNVVSEASE